MASIRHDWYQTPQKVVIDVLVKNANSRNCLVDIQSKSVSIRGDDIQLDFDLACEIDPAKSSFRVLTVKIEISLQKLVGDPWSSLVKTNENVPKPAPIAPTESVTRNKNDKNWDRVVKDACETEGIDKVNNSPTLSNKEIIILKT